MMLAKRIVDTALRLPPPPEPGRGVILLPGEGLKLA